VKRVVIVGGGISGLAAAWAAHTASEGKLEVILLEAEPEVGGKARSVPRGEWLVEQGPTGYLDNESILDTLVECAGLQKLPATESAANRFLVREGRLRQLHTNPLRFAFGRILSPGALLRIAREPWIPRREEEDEESVFDFAERRLGRQAAERLIAPMVLGVFAGDARRLSLPAAFPRMAELERRYGSLFRAMKQLSREKKLRGGPAGPSGVLTSFEGGLQTLPRHLAERAPFTVRTSSPVDGLQPATNGTPWRVHVRVDSEPLPAEVVILAGEAWSTANLLRDVLPEVSGELDALSSPPLAVVALGYGADALARAPRGFGALAPREEGLTILGVLWDTHLFPGRSPDGHILMRAMIGGAVDPATALLDEERLVQLAHEDLRKLLDLRTPPVFTDVTRWPRAIPQYEVGHLARTRRIDGLLARFGLRHPGLFVGGNYRRGVAFGKAAGEGWSAGSLAAMSLGFAPAVDLSPIRTR